MAWVDICSKTYDSNYPGGYVKVVVQYDDSSITTTSLTCRAIGYLTSYNGSHGDTYFIYSSNGGISRICYLGDTYTKTDGSVYYTGNSFTLTKTNTATYFTLPELRLCNDGSHQSSYTDSNGRGYEVYWNNDRHMWTTVNSGGSTISTNVYVTGVGKGTVNSIVDNYNNSYTIKVTRGAAGNYNPVTEARIWWTHNKNSDGTWKYTEADNSEKFETNSKSKTITFTPTTAATRSVVGAVTTSGKYGSGTDTGWQKETSIRQYIKPGLATNLSIGSTKGKFTLKENWTLSWTAANPGAGTATDTYCPVKGYRVRLHRKRNGIETTIPIRNSSGDSLSTYGTDNTYYCDTNNSSTSLTIYPSQYTADELKSGDEIGFSVVAYTKKGKNNDGEMMLGTRATLAANGRKTVKNAGIMRVYNGSQWIEGQVHVYTGTMWKEAESVSAYNGSTWTEAQ